MPRRFAFIALPMMLLTGLILGQLLTFNARPTQLVTRSAADNRSASTADAFYRAVNLYLSTEDGTSLSNLLAPGYVGHATYDKGEESAPMFLRYLERLGNTFPAVQVEATELYHQGDTVAVDVSLTGVAKGAFLGIPIEASEGIGSYEILRIENGQVIERWASETLPPSFQTVAVACIPVGLTGGSKAAVERWIFEVDGVIELEVERPLLFVAEKGAIDLSMIDQSSNRVKFSEHAILAPEPIEEQPDDSGAQLSSVLVSGGTRIRLSNEDSEGTSLHMIAIEPVMSMHVPDRPVLEVMATGVERVLKASHGALTAPKGEAHYRVSVGQVTLPPGSGVPVHTVGVSEFLVVGEGTIDVIVHDQSAVWFPDPLRIVVVAGRQTVGAGEGLRGSSNADLEYLVVGDEPATVWLVTIQELQTATSSTTLGNGSGLVPADQTDGACSSAPTFGITV